jgi:hypothetical protein
MKKKVSVWILTLACFLTFGIGLAFEYEAISPELNAYRQAGFWINYNNQNPDFGYPKGMAWEGSRLVIVYPNGYQIIIGDRSMGQEAYALMPDKRLAPYRFLIHPSADVRRINLKYITGQ